GASWVSEGGVVLHRRPGRRHLVRADPVEEDDLEYAGEQLERVFAAFELIAEEGDGVVDRLRLRLADDARLIEEIDRDGDIRAATFRLEEGTWPELDVEPELAFFEIVSGRARGPRRRRRTRPSR